MWLVHDTGGFITVGMTYLFMLFGCYVARSRLLDAGEAADLLFGALLALAAVAHARCMLTDPGAVPFSSGADANDARDTQVCVPCRNHKPRDAHHCSICGRCILVMAVLTKGGLGFFVLSTNGLQLMDHHCPWVNNCVGKYSRKYFMLFTVRRNNCEVRFPAHCRTSAVHQRRQFPAGGPRRSPRVPLWRSRIPCVYRQTPICSRR
jgi:hypothetical protein